MLIDLHVHSSFTPGCPLDPGDVVARAEAAGLDGVCFTDRATWAGLPAIRALRERSRLAILAGLEVPTDHGLYLCFFAEPEAAGAPEAMLGPPGEGGRWSARALVETVRSRGGVVVAAHPYDRNVERPAGDFVFTLRGLSAIEGLAGTRRSNVNELAIEAADHLSLPCVGGSAAERSLDEIGTAATLFKDEVRDEAALVQALRAGAVWAVAVGEPPRFRGDELARRDREQERERPEGRERRDRRERHDRSGERRGGRRRPGGRGHRR